MNPEDTLGELYLATIGHKTVDVTALNEKFEYSIV